MTSFACLSKGFWSSGRLDFLHRYPYYQKTTSPRRFRSCCRINLPASGKTFIPWVSKAIGAVGLPL